jgi:PilZ domain-containing protein
LTDFIMNPRRSLRLPLRCAARIAVDGVACDGHTEDLGGRGCRLVAPTRLARGSHVVLRLACEGVLASLVVDGQIVWCEEDEPFRHGVVFAPGAVPRAEAWFDEVAAHHSELLHQVRVPDRLHLGARLFVTPAPEAAPRLGDEEAVVLRYACGQPTVAQLQRVLGPDWSRAQKALFNLLGRGTLTLDEAEAGDPQGWRTHLEADRRGGGARN